MSDCGRLVSLKHVSEKLVLAAVLRDGDVFAKGLMADALEEYAKAIRSGAAIADDFEASNSVHVIRPGPIYERRTLVISMSADLPETERFNPVVVSALREYADLIELGKCGDDDNETYRARNGCSLSVVSGINVIS